MKPDILILTKTYSTSLGVIRSLGIAGYHIELFYIIGRKGPSQIPGSSRYIKKVTEFQGRNDEGIIAAILSQYGQSNQQYFLFPTDDYAASLIDRYRDKLSKHFLMPYVVGGMQGTITHLMDKAVQSELAQKCGFPTAREWIVSLNVDVVTIPEDVVFPCFVKPLVSAQGYKRELGVCDSLIELREKLLSLQAEMRSRSVMIQEYLNITQEFSMSGVCLDQKIILPAIVKKIRIAQHERGVTMFGELVPISEIVSVEKALFDFLRSLHFVGMFDLEVMCDRNKIYFGEMNLRSGGPNYSYCLSGVNLPDILVKAIAEGTAENVPEIQLHKKFLYEKAAWEDYQTGFLKKKELKRLYSEADFCLIDCKDDPEPGKKFRRYLMKRTSRIFIKRIVYALGIKIKRRTK